MTVNQEEESLRESCPSRATDQDVGDKINGETKEIEKPRMIGKTKQSHTSVAPTLDVDSSLSKHDPPRRESRIGDVLAAGESESRMTNGKTEIGHVLGESNRFSSLEMRRLPVNILLKPALMDSTSMVSDEFHTDDKDKEVVGEDKDFLHCLCLRPGYSLRTQLMLSFGSISIITIVLVVLICVVVAELVGQNVKNISKTAFEEITTETQILTARYLAETLTEKLLLVDAVKLLVEATRDRFSGYPSASESDVPFFDILSQQGKYPVDFPPPPLEWQFEANVNANNYEEHFQGRNYYKNRDASTASASFVFKGICDPSETDPLGDAFWPNCTDANNDVSTGGVVEPTNTTAVIYNKGKDLIPLLKSIFESRDVINDVGVYFANSGAGATLNYPHYTISTQSSYESTGCGWMTTPNFYDPTRPIGTPEMIERCSPRRTIVSSRMYSPMERGWCVSQALEPDRVHYEAGPDAWDNASWILVMGQAVYDRITQEFLACTYVGITLGVIDQELMQATVVEGEILSLIDHSRGGIIVGSSKPNRNASESVSIYDADFGMTKTEYDELLNLVDYDSQWDPVEVRRKYTDFQVRNGKYFLSTYPIPPVPDGFDRTYMPLFMVVVSTPLESIYGVVSEASDMIDDRVRAVNIFCVTAGAVGLLFALLVISMMAEMLTRPLRKMNQIASEIVNNFGDPTKENAIENSADGNVSGEARCTPKTELSEVVKEFNKLVASFSGSSMVKTEHHKHHEICNTFNLQKEFLTLYESRIQEKFMYSVEPPTRRNFHENAEEECMAYIHGGTNMMDDHDTFTTNPPIYHEAKAQRNFSSPLFLWIVALMVTPLLFVNVIITAVALNTVSNEFAGSVEQAEVFFLNVEKAKLSVQSRLRADFVAGFTAKATSDLFVLTRYAGWLLFGGLGPSNSYNRLMSGAEECKVYNDPLSCPFVEENIFCDCAWKDKITSAPCRSFPEGSRHLQKSFWACQSDDADEKGNRLTSTYPKTSYSPESTVWWGDQESVPGFDNATIGNTGYANLYERLRTAAALPLFEAMYNYPEIKDSTIGIYLAFESDGLFVGYNGCSSANHVAMSRFQSTVENGAARLRPELCPLGKFGFDPRKWYDTGRNLAILNNSYLHVTAPYEFATKQVQTIFAQSATAPLINTETAEHIGQILLDFLPTAAFRTLRSDTPLSTGGFPILVATESTYDADTVIGPDYELSDPPASIASKVLSNDLGCVSEICRMNIETFDEIVRRMKTGAEGNATFYRTTATGSQERVHMAFAPVAVQSFRSVDNSDFSRGLDASQYMIYSLALVEPETGIMERFDPIEEETQQQIRTAIGVLSTLLAVATIIVVYVSLHVTKSIAEPMVYLLEIIRSIRKAGYEEAPDLRTVKASHEIVTFSDSIEMLAQVIRSANTAFYAGEFESAYHVLVDALRLFRRLDNKKAIGIACNNLGNTMMGMYQEMTKESLETFAGLTKRQLIAKGIAYFHEAIELGEKAYDEFHDLHGWTPICLDFMQHLSNRYFNRALFLLCVKDTHTNSDDLEKLGKRDLKISSDMDAEVVAYSEDIGWNSNDRMEKMFDVKIVRAAGYNLLLEMGYKDEWNMKDILDEAFDIIIAEKQRSTPSLFSRLTYPGRMQEIEMEVMKYYSQAMDDIETAAKVAVRCFFEDEKIFVDTMSKATDILLQYVDTRLDWSDSVRSRTIRTLQMYTDMLEEAVARQNETSICEMESDVISKATASSGRARRFSSRSWSLEQSSGRFITMEDF